MCRRVCIHVFKFRLIFFQIKVDFKEICRAEHEYMNIILRQWQSQPDIYIIVFIRVTDIKYMTKKAICNWHNYGP